MPSIRVCTVSYTHLVAEGIAAYYKDAATVKVHALNEALPENGLYSNAMALSLIHI